MDESGSLKAARAGRRPRGSAILSSARKAATRADDEASAFEASAIRRSRARDPMTVRRARAASRLIELSEERSATRPSISLFDEALMTTDVGDFVGDALQGVPYWTDYWTLTT